MIMVKIWQRDTKAFSEKSNDDFNSNLTLLLPEEQYPLNVLWEESYCDGYTWYREFECDIKDRVWVEQWKEVNKDMYKLKYAHKDVLKRGFTPKELNLLNAYQDRFLLLGMLLDNRIEIITDLYIWDNNTNEKYLLPDLFTGKFEDFKKELEKLDLALV